jgi:hypothetical protein
MRKLLNNIGLFEKTVKIKDVPEEVYAYKDPKTDEESGAHMEYLKKLLEEEDNRLSSIDSKTSQFIGQTGLTFSLLSLFVPLLVDKLNGVPIIVKLLLIVILLSSFGFYFLTKKNALKNYNVINFPYSSPAPKNVLTFKDKGLNAFYSEVVRDLLFGLHRNNEINNAKATNLIRSYMTFRIANMLTGILVVIFCVALAFRQPEKPRVAIDKPIKIEHLDTLIKQLSEQKKKAVSDSVSQTTYHPKKHHHPKYR